MRETTLRLTLTWLVVWPFVTLFLIGVRATGLAMPMPVQTLILSLILVPLIGLVIAPRAGRLAARWSTPRNG